MQTVLWGGPLDGQEIHLPDEQVKVELTIPILTNYPPEYADDTRTVVFVKHHYVFDNTARRYNYAGDWG